jgi:hypothetical protein
MSTDRFRVPLIPVEHNQTLSPYRPPRILCRPRHTRFMLKALPTPQSAYLGFPE